ncbi:MAG: molybdopterin-dependent oxidoreductase, partial [Acidobacteria bacterium]|nr:molybdopterin-dependent oxidoreductase [Acidobacteriota bacterium]
MASASRPCVRRACERTCWTPIATDRRGSETPYDVGNVAVTTYACDSPLRAGSYRSLGGAANHFAREAHVDEIAEGVGLDPVELRLRNLTDPRFRRV